MVVWLAELLEAPEPSLEVVKVARLDTVPQVVASVGLVRSEERRVGKEGGAGRSAGPQVRVRPAIEQAGVVGVWEATVQVRPGLVGRTSVMVKPWATPAPVLVPVMT